MINIPFILSKDEHCLTHTGLHLSEFAYLQELFRTEYELHMNERYKEKHGKTRIRALGG